MMVPLGPSIEVPGSVSRLGSCRARYRALVRAGLGIEPWFVIEKRGGPLLSSAGEVGGEAVLG